MPRGQGFKQGALGKNKPDKRTLNVDFQNILKNNKLFKTNQILFKLLFLYINFLLNYLFIFKYIFPSAFGEYWQLPTGD